LATKLRKKSELRKQSSKKIVEMPIIFGYLEEKRYFCRDFLKTWGMTDNHWLQNLTKKINSDESTNRAG
jgi:YesN/AraC family two-component response regulator